jgi:hypothetical protein
MKANERSTFDTATADICTAAAPSFRSSRTYRPVVILPAIGDIECESVVAFWAAC